MDSWKHLVLAAVKDPESTQADIEMLCRHLELRGFVASANDYVSLIQEIATEGHWRSALALFEASSLSDLGGHDVVGFNAAMGACMKGQCWQHALRLFDSMLSLDILPSLASFNLAIGACKAGGRWAEALAILNTMRSWDVTPNTASFSRVIESCQPHGEWEQALRLLERMRCSSLRADALTFESLLGCCRQAGAWEQALVFCRWAPPLPSTSHGRLSSASAPPNWGSAEEALRHFHHRVTAAELAGRWPDSLAVFGELQAQRAALRAEHFTSLLLTCSRAAHWSGALALLEAMRNAHQAPDARCYALAMQACARGGKRGTALALLEEIQELDGAKDLAPAVIEQFSRRAPGFGGRALPAGAYERWEGSFSRAVTLAPPPGAASRTLGRQEALLASLHAAAIGISLQSKQSKQWSRAFHILEEMWQRGAEPSVSVYTASIQACARGLRSEQALWLIEHMNERSVPPQSATFAAAIEACKTSRHWEQALTLLGTMRRRGFDVVGRPSEAALLACMAGQQLDSASQLAAAAWQQGHPQRAPKRRHLLQRTTARSASREEVQGCLELGPRREELPAACARALKLCHHRGGWAASLSLLEELTRQGVELGLSASSILAEGCPPGRALGLLQEAWLLARTPGQREGPDRASASTRDSPAEPPYCTAVPICARRGKWQLVMQLLGEMQERGHRPSEAALSSALDVVAATPQPHWHRALRLIEALRGRGEGLGCGSTGGEQRGSTELPQRSAWELALHDWASKHKRPATALSEDSYQAVLASCQRGGLWQVALDVLQEMDERGVVASDAAALSAVRACEGSAASWRSVLQLLEDSTEQGRLPSKDLWAGAFGTFSRSGQWALALKALGQMSQMSQQSSKAGSCNRV